MGTIDFRRSPTRTLYIVALENEPQPCKCGWTIIDIYRAGHVAPMTKPRPRPQTVEVFNRISRRARPDPFRRHRENGCATAATTRTATVSHNFRPAAAAVIPILMLWRRRISSVHTLTIELPPGFLSTRLCHGPPGRKKTSDGF